jgi:hypothetical protein
VFAVVLGRRVVSTTAFLSLTLAPVLSRRRGLLLGALGSLRLRLLDTFLALLLLDLCLLDAFLSLLHLLGLRSLALLLLDLCLLRLLRLRCLALLLL